MCSSDLLVLATTCGELDGEFANDESLANDLVGLRKQSVRTTIEGVTGL